MPACCLHYCGIYAVRLLRTARHPGMELRQGSLCNRTYSYTYIISKHSSDASTLTNIGRYCNPSKSQQPEVLMASCD
jgi:hypothetical protein